MSQQRERKVLVVNVVAGSHVDSRSTARRLRCAGPAGSTRALHQSITLYCCRGHPARSPSPQPHLILWLPQIVAHHATGHAGGVNASLDGTGKSLGSSPASQRQVRPDCERDEQYIRVGHHIRRRDGNIYTKLGAVDIRYGVVRSGSTPESSLYRTVADHFSAWRAWDPVLSMCTDPMREAFASI